MLSWRLPRHCCCCSATATESLRGSAFRFLRWPLCRLRRCQPRRQLDSILISKIEKPPKPNARKLPAHLVPAIRLAADTATIVLIAAFQSLISRNKMTVLQLAVLLLSHFVILAAGFAPQSVVDVASSSSTELQAKRLPITMPTQTPMVPYRVSVDKDCDRRGWKWLFGFSLAVFLCFLSARNTCHFFVALPAFT